jgi:hypothetical protein
MNRSHILTTLLALLALQLGACSRAVYLDDEAAENSGVTLNGGSDSMAGEGASSDSPEVDASASMPPDDMSTVDAAAPPALELPPSTFTGNPPGCPSSKPEHASACDEESEGDVCAYDYADPRPGISQSIYNECQCRVGCNGTLTPRWDCYENVVSGLMSCPPEKPENGSSCFGFKGYECRYPTRVTCDCSDNEGDDDWKCETASDAREVEPFPAIADDTVLVRDVGDEEAEALCGWLTSRGEGFPEPPELTPDANGLYPSSGCRGSHYFDCHAFWPDDVPASACLDNLAVSSCEASLAELRDCMLTMLSSVPVGIGCGPYFAKPGCSGTIAISKETGSPSVFEEPDFCKWRVQ